LPAEWDPAANITAARRIGELAGKVLKDPRLSTVIPTRKGEVKRHVRLEGWVTLGAIAGPLYGGQLAPQVNWCRRVEGGWEASASACTLDGRVVGRAEAQCTRSETRWADADDHARRSMAETRAAVKAMRFSLGWVLALIGVDVAEAPPEDHDANDHQENHE
jgi:hypothetical protein